MIPAGPAATPPAEPDPGLRLMPVAEAGIARVFREEYGRAVAVLARIFGDLDVAEDAVQDAFTAAVQRWPSRGLPPSPAGWIITTARNRAIDRLRREAGREDRYAQAALLQEARSGPVAATPEELMLEKLSGEGTVADDRLRLIFTCCHPALATKVQVALTLRLLGGLTTAEVAQAFLVPEPTMAQRLVRAKAKIRDARIPYRVPQGAELTERLQGVLAVVYLVFNEGYSPSSGANPFRGELCLESIRLGRLLAVLMPERALGLIDGLGLESYYLFHAVRADFFVRLGRPEEAATAYKTALGLAGNRADRMFLENRLRGRNAG